MLFEQVDFVKQSVSDFYQFNYNFFCRQSYFCALHAYKIRDYYLVLNVVLRDDHLFVLSKH